MRQTLSAIVFLFIASLAQAQDLTDAEIQKWVKAYQAIINWAESANIEEELDNKAEPNEYSRIFSQMMEHSKKSKYYDTLVDVLDDNGYSDPTKWSDTGDRIMLAYVANEMDGQEAEMKQQLQQMQAMMNSGMVPPEQKAMMEQMLAESGKAMQAASAAPEADKKAVKRNQALLNSIMDPGE
ncbi:hypothetical protein [Ketobacter sp.]|uniref:hypothetical protein n=1 Tax=Ketobacter sp. TaxID=2083498 RepID=UPI000F1918A3|nr:hypothetical protein [Ketobacter sp.]RLT92107.1 MAG: hypothetical protein D9N14_21535 [Ketobacter sp.]